MGQALGLISHEINNLLTPIRTSAELALLHDEDPRLAKAALERAVDGCEHAAGVLRAILEFSAGGVFHVEQGPPTCRVGEVVARCLGMLGLERSGSGIEVDRAGGDLEVAMPGVVLQQVVMNVLLNAKKAGRRVWLGWRNGSEDGITRGWEPLARRGGGGIAGAVIWVRDDGAGIDSEMVPTLFDVGATTGGRGFGLAMCARGLGRYGGEIALWGRREGGALVTISLAGVSARAVA